MGRRLRLTQDVRIEVMRPADVERLQEPMCPEPDVSSLLSVILQHHSRSMALWASIGRRFVVQ